MSGQKRKAQVLADDGAGEGTLLTGEFMAADISPMEIDTTHRVADEKRPVKLKIREDVNMRAVYWLKSLTYGEYMALNPRRLAKCMKEGRDVRAEFTMLQAYLKNIAGKENVIRAYAHSKGKGKGRLFSIGHGLQGVWSEVRGILAAHMTDADMSNAHPRILLWICDENGIEAGALRFFINNREVIYNDIIETYQPCPLPSETSDTAGEARDFAKRTVLAMMNDAQPLWTKHTQRVCDLDATFKRLQMEICALPQYSDLEALSVSHKIKTRKNGTSYHKYNKFGSWLNMILCVNENTFLATAREYLEETHGLETGELAFDGLMFYGDHYEREDDLCEGLRARLKEKHNIEMPWSFKRHSSAIKIPDNFQVYEIPQRMYIQNIGDGFLRDEDDFSRIVSAIRGEYEGSTDDERGAFRAAAESLMVRSKRPLNEFHTYWNKQVLALDIQALKFYSRESDEGKHIFSVKTEMDMIGKTEFSETQLRDYFIGVFGDSLLTIKGDKNVYIWWRQKWQYDDGAILGHVLIQMIQKLYLSTLTYYKDTLEKAVTREDWLAVGENKGRAVPAELQGADRTVCADAIRNLSKTMKRYGNGANTHVRKLVVEQLRSFALPFDPFDQKHALFCFTNAVFNVSRGKFVKVSKYDYCLMTCGKPWFPPRPEERAKVAILFESTLPDAENRRGYVSVLKSGMSGTRPENFTLANGNGRNGKGMLNENAFYCAGDYAGEMHLALLTKPIKDGPNPEAAGLHRKRLCIASEPEDGLNEPLRLSNIKKLTGCPELNARMCHSNATKTELCATIIMECNKQPAITGEKGEAALDRIRVFPFDQTFTSDASKLMAEPDRYKSIDLSLKTPEFKEKHRCAFFEYVMRNGGDQAWFPEKTKALGAKYLEENDDFARWFTDVYERDEQQPILHFLSIKDVLKEYKGSEDYTLMSKAEKRGIKETSFVTDIQKNLLLKKDFAAPMKVSVMVERHGQLKRNTRAGLIHWKRRQPDDESVDDFGESCDLPTSTWDPSSQFG